MKNIIRKIYLLIPFKRQLFSIIKIVYKVPENYYRHLFFKGVFKTKINEDCSIKLMHYGFQMENEIFWEGLTGGWEKVSMKLWIDLCRDAEIIFDIGANTGVYALVAKSINNQSKVFAFEPVHRVYEKLKQNNDLNNFDINCFSEAVSDFNGKAIIYDTPTEHIYSVTVNKNLNQITAETIQVEIKTVTIDSIVDSFQLKKIDLIKIDVETHEAEVLKGFENHLQKFRPTLLIEILNDEVGSKVEHLLYGLNYLYFNIDERNGIRQVEHITQSDFYNYLICGEAVAKKMKLI